VHAYDPESIEQARPLTPDASFHDDACSAIEAADHH
jgi:UDPglucose 6-dehydrogenase